MKALILFVLLCLTASPSFAATKAKKPAPVAHTTKPAPSGPAARPVYETDGSFAFCIADQAYPDGKKLTVALSTQNQINIGVHIPKGGFEIGARYDLALTLDQAESRKVRAEALDEETLLLQMGTNPTFRKKLGAAKSLTVGSSNNTVPFDLPPMDRLLENLKTCTATKAGTKDEHAAKTERMMPELLKSLLVTAGFTDIVPLSMEKIPEGERPADFVWRTGSLMAGVRERMIPKDKTLSDIIGIHLQGLKTKCSGTYRAEIGREQIVEDLHLRVAEASCAPKTGAQDKAVMVAMVFYLTKAGVFTVFTHEGLIGQREDALAARDRLAKTLLALAKN